jgi:lysophospholipase L1-like esterase
MRRFLLWTLPLSAALAAVAIFAWGFAAYLRGDTGAPLDLTPPAQTATAAAAPTKLVAPILLGDSLARGAGDETGLGISGRLDQELRRRSVNARRTVNLGVNGARTPDLLRELDRPNVQQLLRESNLVILSIGGNDLWGSRNWRDAAPANPDAAMDAVLAQIETAVRRVRTANPRARICFIALYNPFIATPFGRQLTMFVNRWNARVLQRFATDPDFTLVQTSDLFSHHDRLALDRFHPNGEGYELIARRIADAL